MRKTYCLHIITRTNNLSLLVNSISQSPRSTKQFPHSTTIRNPRSLNSGRPTNDLLCGPIFAAFVLHNCTRWDLREPKTTPTAILLRSIEPRFLDSFCNLHYHREPTSTTHTEASCSGDDASQGQIVSTSGMIHWFQLPWVSPFSVAQTRTA